MAKDFVKSIGKHSRRRPVGKTSATPDIEKIKAENVELKKENAELKEALRSLAEVKNKEIEGLKKKISNSSISPTGELAISSDSDIVYRNKELRSVGTTNLFKAIKEESNIQNREDIYITRADLSSKYNVNPAFITGAIKSLLEFGFIEIIQESPRRRRFKILKELPLVD